MTRERWALAKDVATLLTFGLIGWAFTWFIVIASTPSVAP